MIKYKGGNGTSEQEAVIILNVNNEFEGVDAEYDYMEDKYEQYELVSQEFIDKDDKQFDVLNIQLLDGTGKVVWFDISGFYGKDDE